MGRAHVPHVDWMDEREWIIKQPVPMSSVLGVWINPHLAQIAAEYLPKAALRRVGTPDAKLIAGIEDPSSPRPSDRGAAEVLKAWYGILGANVL